MSGEASKEKTMKQTIIDFLVFLGLAVIYIVEAIVKSVIPRSYRKKKDVGGQIVLITGGGGGLGRLLCQRFSNLGATIVIWDINKTAVEESVKLVKSEGGKAYGYICDLTKREEVYKAAEEVKKTVGKVNILINNAGYVSGKPFMDTPDHQIQQTFDVNVIAHFWTTKAFLPDMIDEGTGHIVTIASMAGFVGITKLVDYCASKFACVGFDEALRLELETMGHHKIHLSSVCPYFIRSTGMFEGVNTRFVPILEATEVADKVVQAVQFNEKRVYLPGYFQQLLLLREFFPWSVYSMFLRTLVLDAHPDVIHQKGADKVKEFTEKTDKIETATENLQSTYRRISSSERKP